MGVTRVMLSGAISQASLQPVKLEALSVANDTDEKMISQNGSQKL